MDSVGESSAFSVLDLGSQSRLRQPFGCRFTDNDNESIAPSALMSLIHTIAEPTRDNTHRGTQFATVWPWSGLLPIDFPKVSSLTEKVKLED